MGKILHLINYGRLFIEVFMTLQMYSIQMYCIAFYLIFKMKGLVYLPP